MRNGGALYAKSDFAHGRSLTREKAPSNSLPPHRPLAGSVTHVTLIIREEAAEQRAMGAENLAKLCGWNEPEKFEHGAGDELTELLIKLRGGSPR